MAKSTTGKKSNTRKSASKAAHPRAESRKSLPSKKVASAAKARHTKPEPARAQTKPAAKFSAARVPPPKLPPRKAPALTIKTPSKNPPKVESATKAGATAPKTSKSKAELAEALKKKGRSVAEVASAEKADAKGYVFINGRRVRMISTKGVPPVKRVRPNGVDGNTEAADLMAIRAIKTQLSRKELNHYRELLLLKRRELIGDLDAMETQALRSGGGNLSHMPIHMADIGTDTYDQDFMLGLAETERRQLREIDDALQRIEDRTYGVCQLTGQPIPTARLDAKPWAKYTVESARKMEGQWGP